MTRLTISFPHTRLIWSIVIILQLVELKIANAQSSTIKGVTIEGRTKLPLPYVSIGIKNKAVGTVSDSTGHYSINYANAEIADQDSIIFSAIGYLPIKMTWERYVNSEKDIKLEESAQLLETVNIKAKPGQFKQYGRSSARIIFFPSMYKSIPKSSDEKGREQATIMKIDQDILLQKLSFTLNRRTFRKIKLRLNIYSVKDGMPDKSILPKDVVFDIMGTKEIGMPRLENIDLRPYNIHLLGHKQIAISLATLELVPLSGDSIPPAFFIPSFPGPLRSSFYRTKGEAQWQKVSSSYLLIALEAYSMNVDNENLTGDIAESEAETIQNNVALSGFLYGNNKGSLIKVDDGEIYYESYGHGRPLFLLHGNNEQINSFREQIGPLSKHFKVIVLDTRGQGNSSNNKVSPYTYEQFAKDLSKVMDALSIKVANIVGWSDGGNTALIFAINHPEKVDKMVLMGANIFPGPDAVNEVIIKTFQSRRDSLMIHKDPYSQNQMRLADLVLKEPRIDITKLQHVVAPVLIVAGEFDVIKKQHTQLIHSYLKNSQLSIIKGGDHYAPLKEPELFNKLVIDFLAPGKRVE